MKFLQILFYVTCLFIFAGGFAQAAILVADNDNYGIPASKILTVEAPGVLKNDTLGGLDAEEAGLTVIWLTGGNKGALTCPDTAEPGLCVDGSFEYIPNMDPFDIDMDLFDGEDSFQYLAVATSGESATATVTLNACSGGPAIFSCWHETPYLAKLTELGYHLFLESFEGSPWDVVRSPDIGTAVTAPSITSKNIVWTTNHPPTNEITTGSGPARSGLWGAFDPEHGLAAETSVGACDVDNPPVACRPYDGFSGSGTALHGVGGYFSGFSGANVAIILDGTNQGGGKLFDAGYHFFGVIDTIGFTGFEFRELDGKVGQELLIFGDDFIIATTDPVAANNPPVLDLIGDQPVDENILLTIELMATDADDGDSLIFSMTGGPAGSDLSNNFDGTATFSWRPDFTQAGVYDLDFTVTDNGLPAAGDSELITITVNDVNRPPVLNHIGDRSVTESTLLSILLTASDPEGNNLSFEVATVPSGSPLPPGSSFTDHINGTATFSWTPVLSQVGDYPLKFTVSDDGVPIATDWEAVTISVVNAADVIKPVITLLGTTPVSIELGTAYDDAGATASDNIDGDISVKIVPTSTVDTNTVGAYSVTYNVSDVAGNAAIPVVRTVNVTADVTKPVITLLGTTPVSIELGTAYDDAGATASDNIDGDISVKIVPTSTVDINTVGAYSVTYNVSDVADNAAIPVVRTVNVTADVTKPVIILLGTTPVSIEPGTAYDDAGATADDNVDGDISISITPTSTVNVNMVGTYSVTYNVSDTAGNAAIPVVRTVYVIPAAGDINGNGTVGLEDMIIALQVLTGQTSAVVFLEADVDGDGRIGLSEGIFVLREVAGLP